MTPSELESALKAAFPDADVRVGDLTGTQDHYDVTITSAAFDGMNRVQQHKLVYQALGDALRGPIHALALKTNPRKRE